MQDIKHWIIAGLLAVVLAGCASTGQQQGEVPVEDRNGAAGAQSEGLEGDELGEGEAMGAEARGAGAYDELEGDELSDPASPLATRIIYFPFDSSEISAEDQAVLEAHGAFLAAHPERRLVLEGHTDERGSREYNLALGENRAKSVERVLQLNGAAAEQLEVVSYGEEKPAELGQNEAAWAKNRRVELIYSQR